MQESNLYVSPCSVWKYYILCATLSKLFH